MGSRAQRCGGGVPLSVVPRGVIGPAGRAGSWCAVAGTERRHRPENPRSPGPFRGFSCTVEHVFEQLEVGIEELQGADLDGLGSATLSEMVERLQVLKARLEAAEARVVARWDAERCWQADGARNGAAWLAWRCRIPVPVAGQRVRHARAVRDLPAVEAAWAAGEIDRSHISTLLGVRNPRTEERFVDGHQELLAAARTLRHSHLRRVCDLWSQLADPDGAEDAAAAERAGREVHLAQSLDGMFFGRVTLDPVSGTIVHETLTAIERELFDRERAETRDRLGRDPMVFELPRTPAQRRADALVEMAIRARTVPAGGKRPAPLFTVVIDHPTLVGPVRELWNRTVLTPGTIARWLSEAEVERVVFGPASRVLEVGARGRFFRGALRRGIQVRDRSCFHPTCDEPPDREQVDHHLEASKGGLTTQDNGRLGCAFHNRRRNTVPDDWDDADVEPHGGNDPPR